MKRLLSHYEQNPALFASLYLLLGAAAALHWHWSYLLFLLLASLPLIRSKKLHLLFYVTLLFSSFCYTRFLYPPISLPAKNIEGTAHFSISSLSNYASPFKQLYLYKGTLKTFTSKEGVTYKNVPCKIYLPKEGNREKADSDYLISGRLIEKGERNYQFKPKKKTAWEKMLKTFSFAELRYNAKENVKALLQKKITDHKSAAFLLALFTGDLEERTLALEFSHLGLQHILAISGFHFAIIAAFLGFILRIFLPKQAVSVVLVLALSIYFLFVGPGASVQRAWIALLIVLIGRIFHMRSSGLNALGTGLGIAILIDPIVILNLGFQLSFLATAAIFIFYPTVSRIAQKALPKREISTVAKMPLLDQHVYLFSSFFREAASLSFAVHLFVLPLLLFSFHKFPILSFVYNLFIPLWTTLSFLLFLTAFLLMLLLPPLGQFLHSINSAFTSLLLKVTAHPLPCFDYTFFCSPFPSSCLICILTLLFFAGLYTARGILRFDENRV